MQKKKIRFIAISILLSNFLFGSDQSNELKSDDDNVQCIRQDMDNLIAEGKLSVKEIFEAIYQTNYWCNPESVSGGGSTLAATATLRNVLPQFLKAYDIEILIDASCGDFHWMQTVDLGDVYYIGVDIVESLINKNKTLYGDTKHVFLCLDITRDLLPQGTMILCRDCFQHLPYEKVFQALRLFKKSGAIYLLATTYKTTRTNHDIHAGETCLYNLQKPPFNFPRPLNIIRETSDEGYQLKDQAKKSLGLWKLDSIPV